MQVPQFPTVPNLDLKDYILDLRLSVAYPWECLTIPARRTRLIAAKRCGIRSGLEAYGNWRLREPSCLVENGTVTPDRHLSHCRDPDGAMVGQ